MKKSTLDQLIMTTIFAAAGAWLVLALVKILEQ